MPFPSAYPNSCYEGRNVEEVRFTSGLKMGEQDDCDADCVCGIPDSGIGQALGYAEGKGIPYHRAITKYTPTWPRSFTPSKQEFHKHNQHRSHLVHPFSTRS